MTDTEYFRLLKACLDLRALVNKLEEKIMEKYDQEALEEIRERRRNEALDKVKEEIQQRRKNEINSR